MNLLLWAFISLQLSLPSAPLRNINDYQTPGYDWKGGPRLHQLNPSFPVTMPTVAHNPKLYTCKQYGLRQVCYFHNNLQPTYSIYWRQFPVYIHA